MVLPIILAIVGGAGAGYLANEFFGSKKGSAQADASGTSNAKADSTQRVYLTPTTNNITETHQLAYNSPNAVFSTKKEDLISQQASATPSQTIPISQTTPVTAGATAEKGTDWTTIALIVGGAIVLKGVVD